MAVRIRQQNDTITMLAIICCVDIILNIFGPSLQCRLQLREKKSFSDYPDIPDWTSTYLGIDCPSYQSSVENGTQANSCGR